MVNYENEQLEYCIGHKFPDFFSFFAILYSSGSCRDNNVQHSFIFFSYHGFPLQHICLYPVFCGKIIPKESAHCSILQKHPQGKMRRKRIRK